MRDLVLTYLKSLKLKNFTIANELPFDQNGTQLYVKNPKMIYVNQEQYSIENFIQTMSGKNYDKETTSVVVYLATDAKQLPQEYSNVVSSIKRATAIDTLNKYQWKESEVNTEYVNDKLVTSIELRYTQLITS